MNINVTKETLELAKAALQAPASDDVAKAYTQATGLVSYDLQAPALNLYPVITPLRNTIARVPGAGGTATNWKAVTGINTGKMMPGVSEGNRSGVISTTTANYVASYKGIGLEDNVSFEADYAAENFQDVKALAALGLLRSTMIAEEAVILGGNGGGNKLTTTNTPTASGVNSGGSLAAATYSVICVALTPDGLARASVSGGVPGQIQRTNADGTTDTFGGGNAKKSTAAPATVGAPGDGIGSITASVTPMPGAAGYAWYWGASGSEVLGAITNINSVVIKAAATGTQAPGTAGVADADYSYNSLLYDGLLTQLTAAGSGAYVQALATGTAGTGTGFTSDGAGGIAEFNTAFQSFWNNYKLSPDTIWMSATDLLKINQKIIANGGAPLIRYTMDAQGHNTTVDAGTVIASVLNAITNQKVQIKVHPNMPQGTVLFYSSSIPYSLSGVGNVVQMKMRRDYYQIEWPLRSRKYEYGVYCDGVLQNYFPPAFGIIYNAAAV